MKSSKSFLFAVLLGLLCVSCRPAAKSALKPQLKLWYDHPATIWEEALPLGNGHLGAMVWGGPEHEELQLNDEEVWAGSPHNNANPLAAEHLDEIRQLIFENRNEEAQQLCGQYISSQGGNGMAYQTVGSLHFDFSHSEDSITDYHRELNISRAATSTTFTQGGVTFTREAFTSLADGLLWVRLGASEKGQITFKASLTSPMRHTAVSANGDDRTLTIRGRGDSMEGVEGKVQFTTTARFIPKGKECRVTSDGETLSIEHADEVFVVVGSGTNFVNYRDLSADADGVCAARLAVSDAFAARPSAKKYERLKEVHSQRYAEQFDRVQLRLGINRRALLPTDQRIREFKENDDPQLVELYFQFGRYLLICCSQPGGQAANLQGIWNKDPMAPWDGKYTSNINLEMNYWPAEVTGLSELHEPMLRLVREAAESGRETAAMYGCRGWALHHNTDIWRSTGAVDGPAYGIWPTCNAWLCQHVYEHYLYTGDIDFLASSWPILRDASKFFVDFLCPEPEHGWMVVAPSFSPENNPWLPGGRSFSVVAGTTMDNQLVRSLFENTIASADLLDGTHISNEDACFVDTLRNLLPRLAPMQIGRWGQLQEWMADWDNPNDHHRHVSHLWGLYPGNQITSTGTPELFQAARTSLEARGDASTGWSMGWKVCLWARLLDGNHAMTLIREQIKPAIGAFSYGQQGGTYPNMFDAHPPFQIDGNFGCTAGIAEMLVQSHEGFVRLLPALPDEWQRGKVTGLRCRGGFEIKELCWEEGAVSRCTIISHIGGTLRVMLDGEIVEYNTKPGKTVVVR